MNDLKDKLAKHLLDTYSVLQVGIEYDLPNVGKVKVLDDYGNGLYNVVMVSELCGESRLLSAQLLYHPRDSDQEIQNKLIFDKDLQDMAQDLLYDTLGIFSTPNTSTTQN